MRSAAHAGAPLGPATGRGDGALDAVEDLRSRRRESLDVAYGYAFGPAPWLHPSAGRRGVTPSTSGSIEARVNRVVSSLAKIPHHIATLIQGRHRPADDLGPVTPARLREAGPFTRLDEAPGTELVLGAMGRLWGPSPGFRVVHPARFTARGEPDHVKLVVGVHLTRTGHEHTVVEIETRIAGTDPAASQRIEAVWHLAGAPARWWVGRCLDVVREHAEVAPGTSERSPSPGQARGGYTVPE